ncbi:MAG: nucleotidyltransferase family protein, partial [Ruegeria sp.]
LALSAGSVIVALPPAPHPRYAALEGLDVRSVAVPDAAEGINASLRTALTHVPDDAKAVMVLLADQPDLTVKDLKALMATVSKHPDYVIWRGATEDGKPGHPVIFDRSMFDDLSKLTGDTGAKELVQSVSDKVNLVRLPGQNARLDLDTPEDWKDWLERNNGKSKSPK